MKYEVTPRATDHTIDLTVEDIKTAVEEWLDRNATVDIPVAARLHLSEDRSTGGISGYMTWDSDDIEANPLNTGDEVD